MLTLLISFAATVASAPLVRRSMTNIGVVDRPNHRSSHTRVTPRGGGLACLVGVATAIVIGSIATGFRPPWTAVFVSMILCAVGYLDDRHNLPPLPRLTAQVIAGAAVGAAVGGLPWATAGVVVVPFIVNMVNFMDGINGITGLHVGWWGLVALWLGARHGVPSLAVIGALCAGCGAGFLPSNFPHARLFLGDAGSYLFGGLLAAGILYGGANLPNPALVLAPLVLYVVDTVSTLVRRIYSGAPLMTAHRDHIYQQLTGSLHYSHPTIALGMLVISVLISLAWFTVAAAGLVTTVLASVFYFNATRILPASPVHTEG